MTSRKSVATTKAAESSEDDGKDSNGVIDVDVIDMSKKTSTQINVSADVKESDKDDAQRKLEKVAEVPTIDDDTNKDLPKNSLEKLSDPFLTENLNEFASKGLNIVLGDDLDSKKETNMSDLWEKSKSIEPKRERSLSELWNKDIDSLTKEENQKLDNELLHIPEEFAKEVLDDANQ